MYAILAAEDLPANHTVAFYAAPGFRVYHAWCIGAGGREWNRALWFRVSIDDVSSWEFLKDATAALARLNEKRST